MYFRRKSERGDYRHKATYQASLKQRLMSVNDIPRDTFGEMEKRAPPDYSASCSNNGEHSGQAFSHSVMTADLVQEQSKICLLHLTMQEIKMTLKITKLFSVA